MAERGRVYRCFDCGLPDPYNGAGDGIGSCECSRCEWCAGPPGICHCEADDYDYVWRSGEEG